MSTSLLEQAEVMVGDMIVMGIFGRFITLVIGVSPLRLLYADGRAFVFPSDQLWGMQRVASYDDIHCEEDPT